MIMSFGRLLLFCVEQWFLNDKREKERNMKENLKKYLVEFIGTFFLVFTVCSAVFLAGEGVIGAISIGVVLMTVIYAGGHVSGGHYNPAVTLACAIRGALGWGNVIPYWIAQVLGAIAAAFIAGHFAQLPAAAPECPFTLPQIIVGEFLFTFLLCYVVLQVATSKKTEGNGFYGFAIGATVLVGAFAVGGILCYGCFNPAVACGLGFANGIACKCVGITALVNLIAGICAAITFKMTDPE